MDKQIPSSLKAAFLIHAVLALVFGLGWFLFPETVGDIFNWEMSDPLWRVIGAFMLTLGISSFLAYLASTWEEVRLKVQLEMSWTLLGGIAILWGLLNEEFPVIAWGFFGMLALFFVVFVAAYLREEIAPVAKPT